MIKLSAMKTSYKKPLKLLASLKFAVVNIISLSVIVAVGTIIESKYDATVAKAWVYSSWLMYLVMSLLAVNLTAVMVDRWPWQRRHYPFVMAHIGILTLLMGSLVTAKYGLDGSMRIPIGQHERMVTLPQAQLAVYSTLNGTDYKKLFEKDVNFFAESLEKNPLSLSTEFGELRFSKFLPFITADRKIIQSKNLKTGTAIRFQISNANANMTEWLLQAKPNEAAEKTLGPAKIILGKIPEKIGSGNEIYVEPIIKSPDQVQFRYLVTSKDNKYPALKGKIEEGGAVKTPWMGLEFKILRAYAHGEEKWEFKTKERPGPMTTSAVEFTFQEEPHTLQADDIVKFYTDKGTILIAFGRKRIDLGFDILLNNFEINHHQGTMMAANYKSLVQAPDGTHSISMNEPMKLKGLTFYQASFEQDPGTGEPTASILSVNDDPGRFIKYFGSLLITLGSVWLIYNKRRAARNMGPQLAEEVTL